MPLGKLRPSTNVIKRVSRAPLRTSRPFGSMQGRAERRLAAHSGASEGALFSWGGNNIFGRLGNGNLSDVVPTPQEIGNLRGTRGWALISAGDSHTMGIKLDGTLWGWGDNNNGRIGSGSQIDVNPLPVQIGDDKWIDVDAGVNHTHGIKEDGTLWSWGINVGGRLGDGTDSPLNPKLTPFQIGSATWKQIIATEWNGYGIQTDGTLWSWGFFQNGRLGISGASANQLVPAQIGTDTDWDKLTASGFSALAIKTNGELWGWGSSATGRLGADFGGADQLVPVQIGTDTDWAEVSAGEFHLVGLKTDGTLWTSGFATSGRLGNGTTSPNLQAFAQVGSETDWAFINAQEFHSLAIKNNGTLWGWGNDDFAELGQGSPHNDFLVPTRIGNETDWIMARAGFRYSVGIRG